MTEKTTPRPLDLSEQAIKDLAYIVNTRPNKSEQVDPLDYVEYAAARALAAWAAEIRRNEGKWAIPDEVKH